jgi:hemin uptake protein HemP
MSTGSSTRESTIKAKELKPPTNRGAASANSNESLSSSDILQGRTTVEINHNGATYRLQATRLGKLILTK